MRAQEKNEKKYKSKSYTIEVNGEALSTTVHFQ
jgi:hypothetical protein